MRGEEGRGGDVYNSNSLDKTCHDLYAVLFHYEGLQHTVVQNILVRLEDGHSQDQHGTEQSSFLCGDLALLRKCYYFGVICLYMLYVKK